MIDSVHKASKAVSTSLKGVARGLLCMGRGNHTEDQPESCKDTNGSESSQNINYAAPASAPSPGYDICNDNGVVIIEGSDEVPKIHGIRNRARDNIGNKNGIVEIQTGNLKKIHNIKNRTFNNVGNENGVVKIGKFPSA